MSTTLLSFIWAEPFRFPGYGVSRRYGVPLCSKRCYKFIHFQPTTSYLHSLRPVTTDRRHTAQYGGASCSRAPVLSFTKWTPHHDDTGCDNIPEHVSWRQCTNVCPLMMVIWPKHVMALTSEEEKENCCVDEPIIALLINPWTCLVCWIDLSFDTETKFVR
jgi:hypothetical protein